MNSLPFQIVVGDPVSIGSMAIGDAVGENVGLSDGLNIGSHHLNKSSSYALYDSDCKFRQEEIGR